MYQAREMHELEIETIIAVVSVVRAIDP